jgi:hypothetical protein
MVLLFRSIIVNNYNKGWLTTLEEELTRKNKVKKALTKEINTQIEQLALLEEDIGKLLDEALGGQDSREDVEFDLLYARLNGRGKL